MTSKKFQALLTAGLFVLVVLFSVAFIALEANHDCSGDECPVCLQLCICSDNLKSLSLSLLALTFCALIYSEKSRILLSRELRAVQSDLISLKVKLSD